MTLNNKSLYLVHSLIHHGSAGLCYSLTLSQPREELLSQQPREKMMTLKGVALSIKIMAQGCPIPHCLQLIGDNWPPVPNQPYGTEKYQPASLAWGEMPPGRFTLESVRQNDNRSFRWKGLYQVLSSRWRAECWNHICLCLWAEHWAELFIQ